MVTELAAASHPDWWSGTAGAVVGAIVGAIIGSCVPLAWTFAQRRRERHGEIDAMHIELLSTRDALVELRKRGILAPLYHLPVAICQQALPKLIGDGVLSFNEVGALVQYVNSVEELNRGLERARDAASTLTSAPLDNEPVRIVLREATENEYARNCEKARELLEKPNPRVENMPLFEAAENVLFRLEEARTRIGRPFGFTVVVAADRWRLRFAMVRA
jgi:hypothetical protein